MTLLRPATFALLLVAGLPGCAAISALGGAATPLEAYEISTPAVPVARRPSGRELVVELPGAGGGFQTDRIMLRPNPLQAQYLPGARWTEETPALVQTLMLRSLDATGGFRHVGRKPLGSFGDVALVSEILDFQGEAQDGTATVRLRLSARLVRESDARVIAGRQFVATTSVADLSPLAVVEGFDRAAAGLMAELAGWVLSNLGVPAGPAG
ncbi:MAG: ABC-type transport auxiliary lipoprotein family protein [Gemmobacter sp.]